MTLGGASCGGVAVPLESVCWRSSWSLWYFEACCGVFSEDWRVAGVNFLGLDVSVAQ